MSAKKILVIGAGLGSALVAILKKAEGTELHGDLVVFDGQLQEFLNQQPDQAAALEEWARKYGALEVELAEERESLHTQIADLNLVITQAEARYTTLENLLNEERDVAKETIEALKIQLNEALLTKEKATDKLVVTIDRVKYIVNHGAHPYSAKELADNPEAAKKVLLIKGQKALTKL